MPPMRGDAHASEGTDAAVYAAQGRRRMKPATIRDVTIAMALESIDREDHAYLSTACAHGACSQCRKKCKFCDADCLYACHGAESDQHQGDPKEGKAKT